MATNSSNTQSPEYTRRIERKVAAMVTWLETNQPDVFQRGLWEAIEKAGGGAETDEEADPCVSHLALKEYEREITGILDQLGTRAIRVREGGGAENLLMSLAVTVAKLANCPETASPIAAELTEIANRLADDRGNKVSPAVTTVMWVRDLAKRLTGECETGNSPPNADWLWGEFMDWCRKRGAHPGDYNDLFAIVRKAREHSGQKATSPMTGRIDAEEFPEGPLTISRPPQ